MARIFRSQLSSPCEFQVVCDAICAFEKNMVETFDFIVHFPSESTLQPEELYQIISQIKDDVPSIISLKEFSAKRRHVSASPVEGVRNVMLSADGGMPLDEVCSLLSTHKEAASPATEDFSGLDSAFRSISWLGEAGRVGKDAGATGFSTPSTDFEGSSRYGAGSPVPQDCFAFGKQYQ
jgi:hypothetical protein